MHMCSYIALVAQVSPCVSFHIIHACALVSGCLSGLSSPISLYFFLQFLFQLYLMSILAPDEISMEDPLCDSSLGSKVTLDYVTPLTGYEPEDMDLTDVNELNLATSSDIYFQNALDDTASFSNVPDVDDNELAEFLAVVVDRTGQPAEVRSNNDQFSCDIRNLKSAQSQFPLVTQPKRMISQTGRSVQERIAEERESSNAQIRTMLDEQRRTIITEYSEKVLHHELLAAQAEQDLKILQEELLRQQQDFREVHQQDLMKQKELKKFQNSTFDEFAQKKFIEDQKIMELSGRLQELQNEVNCMNDARVFGMLSRFVVEILTLPVHLDCSLDILHLKDY